MSVEESSVTKKKVVKKRRSAKKKKVTASVEPSEVETLREDLEFANAKLEMAIEGLKNIAGLKRASRHEIILGAYDLLSKIAHHKKEEK